MKRKNSLYYEFQDILSALICVIAPQLINLLPSFPIGVALLPRTYFFSNNQCTNLQNYKYSTLKSPSC
jgi:hypothetical protein